MASLREVIDLSVNNLKSFIHFKKSFKVFEFQNSLTYLNFPKIFHSFTYFIIFMF